MFLFGLRITNLMFFNHKLYMLITEMLKEEIKAAIVSYPHSSPTTSSRFNED